MTRYLAVLLLCLASSAQAETCIASVYTTMPHMTPIPHFGMTARNIVLWNRALDAAKKDKA